VFWLQSFLWIFVLIHTLLVSSAPCKGRNQYYFCIGPRNILNWPCWHPSIYLCLPCKSITKKATTTELPRLWKASTTTRKIGEESCKCSDYERKLSDTAHGVHICNTIMILCVYTANPHCILYSAPASTELQLHLKTSSDHLQNVMLQVQLIYIPSYHSILIHITDTVCYQVHKRIKNQQHGMFHHIFLWRKLFCLFCNKIQENPYYSLVCSIQSSLHIL
jgi:hypothetical protein